MFRGKKIIHRNKRFRHLSINIFKELFAYSVHIKHHNRKNNKKSTDNNNSNNKNDDVFSSLEDSVKNIIKDESISEINIDKFHIDFINNSIFSFVQTGHVHLNSFNKRLKFNNGLIISLTSGSKLIAQDGEWIKSIRKLYVSKKFIIIDKANNKLKGSNAFITPSVNGFIVSDQ